MNRYISISLLFLCLPLFSICVKPELNIQEVNDNIKDSLSKEARSAFDRFNSLSKLESFNEAFIFFTDPHLLKSDNIFSDEEKNSIVEAFTVAKELFDTLKLDFCLCGGDWINSGNTQDVAKEKLLFADRQMKLTFPSYHKMMGNHDTNYQGIVSINNCTRGDLPRDFIDGEYFNETGSAYYSFFGANTLFFVLDSGLDWTTEMNDYRWEQLIWLSDQLLKSNFEHSVLCLHMFKIKDITPMSKLLVELGDAYNLRRSITIKGKEYDFSTVKGKIHFVLSGHNHEDGLFYVGENNSIPVIQTCNYTINATGTFDICAVDYENNYLKLIRVGIGEDREVHIL